LDEVTPEVDEEVVFRYRSGSFGDTPLELLLRSMAIRTVVVAGFGVSDGIESTVREACDKDHYVVLAEDCMSSAGRDREDQDASMRRLERRCARVAQSHAILATWQGHSVQT